MSDVVVTVEATPNRVIVLEGAPNRVVTVGIQGPPGTSRSTKTGIIAAGGFTGSPRKSVVVFAEPYLDSDYTISVTGADARTWTYESKTEEGFTLNANAATALTGEVSWTTMVTGET